MKTDNIRLASFLLTKGHQVQGITIAPEGFGVLSFADDARADADSFDLGATAPAKALLANYRSLIRRLDECKRGGGR